MKVAALFLMVVTLLLSACAQAATPGPVQQTNVAENLRTAWATTTAQAEPTTTVTATFTVTATQTEAPTQAPSPTEAPTSPNRLVETAAAYRTKVARLTPTVTPTPSLMPTSLYPALTISTEIPALGFSGMASLHGLIIFHSKESLPFPPLNIVEGENQTILGAFSRHCTSAYSYQMNNCLWAFSPDGQSGILLSPKDFDTDVYLPPNGLPLIVENGFTTNHPAIQGVRLPEMCSQDPNSSVQQRCDQTRFSSNGRYLAFRYGDDPCAKRAMQIIDRQTGAVVLEYKGGVDRIEPLPNGKMMILRGSCGGMGVSFFDPATRQSVDGGGVMGEGGKNKAGSILIGGDSDFYGKFSELWGYNLNTGRIFRPEGKYSGVRYDGPVIFLPDDRRFLYQHLLLNLDKASDSYLIDTPAQIVRYDPISGQRKVLTSDPAYHYRLCQFDPQTPCPVQWHGDWIQVQRVPFTPIRPKGYEWSISSELPCFARGLKCNAPPESFALNANTGELRPWDPAALPQAAPTPTPVRSGPDIHSQPLYSDPAGLYALYIGTDGKSLWMQPKEGPAVRWVFGGDGFFYLP